VWRCVWKSGLWPQAAARGPPKTSFEPRRGRSTVFQNSRIPLSAGRRACKPAANKPVVPGVILLRARAPQLGICEAQAISNKGQKAHTIYWERVGLLEKR
jgi:hypothetical protein